MKPHAPAPSAQALSVFTQEVDLRGPGLTAQARAHSSALPDSFSSDLVKEVCLGEIEGHRDWLTGLRQRLW